MSDRRAHVTEEHATGMYGGALDRLTGEMAPPGAPPQRPGPTGDTGTLVVPDHRFPAHAVLGLRPDRSAFGRAVPTRRAQGEQATAPARPG